MARTSGQIPRPVNRWTAIKLEHLGAYLAAYARATTRARERYYIDAFAGCGECVIRDAGTVIDGSARRALQADPPFTACYFVELNARLADHLRREFSGYTNVFIFQGDCNQVIPNEILPRIPRWAPSLAFLDPTGGQVHWATVRALAAHRLGENKMEQLILFPYDMFIVRWLRNPQLAPTLTAMFGGLQWQEELRLSSRLRENHEQRRQRFINLYRSGLESLGYRHVDVHGPLYSKRRPLYHMFFAGDHDVGAKIMREVWSKPRAIPGELWYEPSDPPA